MGALSNLAALEEFLLGRRAPGVPVALARKLAAVIDAQDNPNPALVKVYWDLHKALAGDSDDADPADEWLRSLSAEVGDPSKP